MNYPNEKLYPVPELGGDTGRALRACGLWLVRIRHVACSTKP